MKSFSSSVKVKNVTMMENTSNILKAMVAVNNETYEIHGLHINETDDDFLKNCDSCNISATAYMNVYANYHGYLAIVVCIFGTIANMFNIMVLTKKEMACAPINRILTGLAAADMLLMLEYMVFAYYYHMEVLRIFHFPYWGAVFMLIHIHFTQILHTISVCLTLALAVWRYLAIGYPEKSSALCSEGRCTFAIVLSYLLPIVLCIPTYSAFTIQSTVIKENGTLHTLYHTTVSKNENFIMFNLWTYAVLMKLIPCLILTLISAWLIKTLYKAKKRKKVLKTYNQVPKDVNEGQKKKSKADRRADRTTKMLVAVLILFLITEFPQGIFGLLSGLRGRCFFLKCYQAFGDIMDMLALLNGSINFILYCCMNRMFRVIFGQMFKNQILVKWSLTSANSDIHTTRLWNKETNSFPRVPMALVQQVNVTKMWCTKSRSKKLHAFQNPEIGQNLEKIMEQRDTIISQSSTGAGVTG